MIGRPTMAMGGRDSASESVELAGSKRREGLTKRDRRTGWWLATGDSPARQVRFDARERRAPPEGGAALTAVQRSLLSPRARSARSINGLARGWPARAPWGRCGASDAAGPSMLKATLNTGGTPETTPNVGLGDSASSARAAERDDGRCGTGAAAMVRGSAMRDRSDRRLAGVSSWQSLNRDWSANHAGFASYRSARAERCGDSFKCSINR